MPTTRKTIYPLTAFAGFLFLFGWVLLAVLNQTPSMPVPLPEQQQKLEEETPEETTEREESRLRSVDLVYEADISETALEEMENGRFLVETLLPEGPARQRVFSMLRARAGIVVARDIYDDYQLLAPDGTRTSLAGTTVAHENYAFHRPRRIAYADLALLSVPDGRPGDIPYLVMPKRFEARILSEIERSLPQPLEYYSAATLRLEPTPGGHLRLHILSATDRKRQTFAIDQTVPGL